jgi:hypothetical protein
VIAREAVLNDPKVVALLRKHFVCVAIANAGNENTTAQERIWARPLGGNASTQGMSAFTAGGKLLARGGGFQAAPVRKMLQVALSKFEPEEAPVIETAAPKDAVARPPEGGLVLYVTWKVIDRKQLAGSSSGEVYDKVFRTALGVDRLWVRKDEAQALAKGDFPDSLRKRMAPHLKFVVPGKLKTNGIQLTDGRLSGFLLSEEGDRSDALGFLETEAGKVTRFDLVIKGLGMRCGDHGFEAGLSVMPKGEKVQVAVSFMLADPSKELSRTLPHRARGSQYLK